ncbi:hypothetical protein CDV55_106133 [Aspergillus turcosus]|nr:hypothetical protein CDV55_106133 [Aspergillus turcosus]
MASSNDVVFLTGANGFLGFRVLVFALQAGYKVRFAVRSASKAEKVLSMPSLKALNPSSDQLSWVIVPDMTLPGAYDEAVRGAKYVIHAASPIPSFGDEAPTPEMYERYFVEDAKKGTIGILESAKKAGTVKRVVLTSSIVANIPFANFIGQGDDRVFDADSRIDNPSGPYQFEFQAYAAGKAVALNEAESWQREQKPGFDIIKVLPGWIFGRDELSTTADDLKSGSNSVLLSFLTGNQSDQPFNGNSAHVDDCAKVHVLALDPAVKENESFVVSSDGVNGMQWSDAIEVVKRFFPDAVADGRLKTTGKQPTLLLRIDAQKTEETFGFKLAGYEEQVKSLVGQYLQMVKA